jgi:ethanolamine ammonia-lyase small subunit
LHGRPLGIAIHTSDLQNDRLPHAWQCTRRNLDPGTGSSVHYGGLPRIIEATLEWDRPDLTLNSGRSSTRIRPMDNDSHIIERFALSALPDPGATLSRPPPLPTTLADVRSRTPARILIGRAGPAYRTTTLLELRTDHAAARDAVRAELDLTRDFGAPFVAQWGLFEIATLARTKEEFLLRPDLGRSLSDMARTELASRCCPGADIQVAIADGLSAAAVQTQVPTLLPLLALEASRRGWRFGQPFFIRHGRVGTLNDIGEVLDPTVAVLLIGERPGLATAESLSAYMAYRPRVGHDDAHRNLISNIHIRGIPPDQAAPRIARLAARMIQLATSGVAIKEECLEMIPIPVGPG